MPDSIRLDAVSFGHADQPVLESVGMSVGAGGMVVVTGPSGSGKSTLLEICAALLRPHRGTVSWDGQDMWKLTEQERLALRWRTGYVFQSQALISNLTAFENIALPLRYHTGLGQAEIRERVEERLAALDIRQVAARRPEQLSVQQARLTALARATVMEPEVLFLDEPTAGVDPVTTHRIVHEIERVHREGRAIVIMASHSVRVARRFACPVAVLGGAKLAFLEHTGRFTADIEPFSE
jgi:phospholipid/cholesterol/gamma-HCH transport system ATP-binding protein